MSQYPTPEWDFIFAILNFAQAQNAAVMLSSSRNKTWYIRPNEELYKIRKHGEGEQFLLEDKKQGSPVRISLNLHKIPIYKAINTNKNEADSINSS